MRTILKLKQNIVVKILAVLPVAIFLVGCSDDDSNLPPFADHFDTIFCQIELFDENGENLLSRDNPNNWLDRSFSVSSSMWDEDKNPVIFEGLPEIKNEIIYGETIEYYTSKPEFSDREFSDLLDVFFTNNYNYITVNQPPYSDKWTRINDTDYSLYITKIRNADFSIKIDNYTPIDLGVKYIETDDYTQLDYLGNPLNGGQCKLTYCSVSSNDWIYRRGGRGYGTLAGARYIATLRLYLNTADFPRE